MRGADRRKREQLTGDKREKPAGDRVEHLTQDRQEQPTGYKEEGLKGERIVQKRKGITEYSSRTEHLTRQAHKRRGERFTRGREKQRTSFETDMQ